MDSERRDEGGGSFAEVVGASFGGWVGFGGGGAVESVGDGSEWTGGFIAFLFWWSSIYGKMNERADESSVQQKRSRFRTLGKGGDQSVVTVRKRINPCRQRYYGCF